MRTKLTLALTAVLGAGMLLTDTLVAAHTRPTATGRQSYEIIVDKEGRMRRSDTNEEVAYYGTNYTLPFAHAYRATGEMNLDRKAVIDADIYHMKRLGFNGFRLHLWDVELSDSLGNLIENEHLDLLDYMISRLEQEGIDVILTAQTNFGNGYPEKNIDTGAFTYDYDKCRIHEDPQAQKAQERYLRQLAEHVNPYNSLSYGADKGIIAVEINNEPCHSGTQKEVTSYINRMERALRKGGFDRIVLYNVSHNPDVTPAYYDARIQGTTYQWYPDGLVAGHERKGNLLPYVDAYPIPWSESIRNYPKMAKVVYEFDPGDVLCSYLYPAVARTFRKEGFQWATQFAYDPTPIAPYNTEYQTHYLNLLYTPAKALSMAVAAEAMRSIPYGADYGTFPTDTVFGDFRVSYAQDLSEYNTPTTFIYTRSTSTLPKDAKTLQHIAGTGNSPVAEYSGAGAYFLDRIADEGGDAVWRLEVLPDAVIVSDPFAKPSLKKEVARLYSNTNYMKLSLPSMGGDFQYVPLADGTAVEKAVEGVMSLTPGVYLLSASAPALQKAVANPAIERRFAAEEAMPKAGRASVFVDHTPLPVVVKGEGKAGRFEDVVIEAMVMADVPIDSVMIYPSSVSFWRDDNPLVKMNRGEGKDLHRYSATLPMSATGPDALSYNIVVFTSDGKQMTWPQRREGTPLSWDFEGYEYYTTPLKEADSPVMLLQASGHDAQLENSMIPENWNFRVRYDNSNPTAPGHYAITTPVDGSGELTLRRYVGEELKGDTRTEKATTMNVLLASVPEDASGVSVGLVGKNGLTYTAPLSAAQRTEVASGVVYELPLNKLGQTRTQIIPTPFPLFLPRYAPESPAEALNPAEVDFVEFRLNGHDSRADLISIWMK